MDMKMAISIIQAIMEIQAKAIDSGCSLTLMISRTQTINLRCLKMFATITRSSKKMMIKWSWFAWDIINHTTQMGKNAQAKSNVQAMMNKMKKPLFTVILTAITCSGFAPLALNWEIPDGTSESILALTLQRDVLIPMELLSINVMGILKKIPSQVLMKKIHRVIKEAINKVISNLLKIAAIKKTMNKVINNSNLMMKMNSPLRTVIQKTTNKAIINKVLMKMKIAMKRRNGSNLSSTQLMEKESFKRNFKKET